MATSATELQLIGEILQAVLNDVPMLIEVVESIIPIFKENRVPTTEEWTALESLIGETHSTLQTDIQTEITKLGS